MLIRLSSTPFAPRAVISTVCPPAVSMRPALVTRLVTASPFSDRSWPACSGLSARLISASPYRSTVKVSPLPSTTLPRRAAITPSLRTCGATSATRPPSRAEMLPRFRMPAPMDPGVVNASLPSMKSSSLMFAVLAIRLPTFTCDPPPNTMPFGFISSTVPLASSRPRISDTCSPVTRFSVAALAFGWAKITSPFGPMLKLRQSMMARWLRWSIRVEAVPSPVTRASPARTTAPDGPCAKTLVVPVPVAISTDSTTRRVRRERWKLRRRPTECVFVTVNSFTESRSRRRCGDRASLPARRCGRAAWPLRQIPKAPCQW